MKPKTVYGLMFLISLVLVAVIVRLPKIFDWFFTVDALSLLFTFALVMTFVGLIGRNGHRDREKIDKILHEERQERVKWMIEPVLEKRKKELMQKQKVDVE